MSPLLGQIADVASSCSGRLREDLYRARIGLEYVHHDADGGRFAGSIGAQ